MKETLRNPVRFSLGIVILLIFGCAGCSTNPREGGLAGGVYGLSSGKYEERVNQRDERLEKLKELQQELEKEKETLEVQKAKKSRELADIQNQLDDLQKKSQTLAYDVDRFQATLQEQAVKRDQLRVQLVTLHKKIETLSIKSTHKVKLEQLEMEREALENEYRQLLELYRELSK